MRLKCIIIFIIMYLWLAPKSFAYDRYWDYYGSGRDYAYSQYIDLYNSPGYISSNEPIVDDPRYFSTVTITAEPSLTALPPQEPAMLLPPSTEEFTVNIPNEHGGYNSVVLKKLGSGYTGPQGEYYSAFPSVSLLKLIYGK